MALAMAPFAAGALGLDRSGQPVTLLFEEGNYAELSFGRIFPSIDGRDIALLGEQTSGSVAENFSRVDFGLKYQFTDRISGSLSFDQPYGLNIRYPDSVPGGDGSLALGGTEAIVDSRAIEALARYEFNDAFSIHGGLRYQEIQADVRLSGAAPGPLSGYRSAFEADGDLGYVIGAAYERPEIALRLAVTYISGTTHDLPTRETLNGIGVGDLPAAALGLPVNPFSTNSDTRIETPEAVNVAFQTGIAADTLLFGSVRYAWYDDTRVSPVFYDTIQDGARNGDSLTTIEDGYAVNIGLGRQLTDRLSGSVAIGYEDHSGDVVSPLAPTDGTKSLALGLRYETTTRFSISGGIRYDRLGDADIGPREQKVADFDDNDAVSLGLSVGYRF